jgi:hypothetical protein
LLVAAEKPVALDHDVNLLGNSACVGWLEGEAEEGGDVHGLRFK